MKALKVIGTIVGGAAIGVTAVVAAPIFGAVGTVTAVGAAVGVGVGAAAGGIAATVDNISEEETLNKAKQEGFQEGKASNTKTIIDLEAKIKNMSEEIIRYKGYATFEDYITAAFALAISVANCDGDLCNEEIEAIELIISGESAKALPQSVLDKINQFFIDILTFNTAMKYVKKVDSKYYDSFDEIIREVIWSDGTYHSAQAAFVQAWNKETNRNLNVEAC